MEIKEFLHAHISCKLNLYILNDVSAPYD